LFLLSKEGVDRRVQELLDMRKEVMVEAELKKWGNEKKMMLKKEKETMYVKKEELILSSSPSLLLISQLSLIKKTCQERKNHSLFLFLPLDQKHFSSPKTDNSQRNNTQTTPQTHRLHHNTSSKMKKKGLLQMEIVCLLMEGRDGEEEGEK
jgi:hypothetical protein